MHRSVTNAIRFLMDECLPPLVRDSYWFMYPACYLWFKGKDVHKYMHFKSLVYRMSEEEYARAYEEVECRANDRPTDMNTPCTEHLIGQIPADAETLLDAGCGRGSFLEEVAKARPELHLTGCDVMRDVKLPAGSFLQANIENLPFENDSFDVVCCTHTLEHIVNIRKAIDELKRVAKGKLIIVVPKQRYYYYTLDLHVHFFPFKERLIHLVGMDSFSCALKGGDWAYVADKQPC